MSNGTQLSTNGLGQELQDLMLIVNAQAKTPMAVNRAIRESSELGISWHPKYEPGITNSKPISYQVTGDTEKALELLKATMRSSSEIKLLEEIMWLWQMTKPKNDEDENVELKIKTWVNELSQFPSDMTTHAIKQWPYQNIPAATFFPSWNEIYGLFIDALEDRKLMLKACEE